MIHYLNCGTSENSSIWFCKDREGIFTSAITQILLLLAFLLTRILLFPTVIQNESCLYFTQIFLIILYIVCAYCHLACMFTDPGSVPHNAHPLHTKSTDDGDLLLRCGICNAFKPSISHHCKVCNRCILKMDHHCPWINNCVGMMNLKFFFLFLLYSIVLCIIVFLFSFICFFHLLPLPINKMKVISCLSALLGIAFPFFFVVFGIMIGIDTMKTVISGQTKIDRKKGTANTNTSLQLCLRDVFGGDGSFSLFWFIPTRPVFVHSLGYELDQTGERWNGYQV